MEHAAGSRIEGATLIAVLVPDLRLTSDVVGVSSCARKLLQQQERGRTRGGTAQPRPHAARPRKQKARRNHVTQPPHRGTVGDRILGVVPEVAPDFNLFGCRNARRATTALGPTGIMQTRCTGRRPAPPWSAVEYTSTHPHDVRLRRATVGGNWDLVRCSERCPAQIRARFTPYSG